MFLQVTNPAHGHPHWHGEETQITKQKREGVYREENSFLGEVRQCPSTVLPGVSGVWARLVLLS